MARNYWATGLSKIGSLTTLRDQLEDAGGFVRIAGSSPGQNDRVLRQYRGVGRSVNGPPRKKGNAPRTLAIARVSRRCRGGRVPRGHAGDGSVTPYTNAIVGRRLARSSTFFAPTASAHGHSRSPDPSGPRRNCDAEAQFAFELAGAEPSRVHVNRLRENPGLLRTYEMLAIPGGFTYGDDVAAGKILATELHQLSWRRPARISRSRKTRSSAFVTASRRCSRPACLVPPDEDGPCDTLAITPTADSRIAGSTLQATPGQCIWLKDCDRYSCPSPMARAICLSHGLDSERPRTGRPSRLRYTTPTARPGPSRSIRTARKAMSPAFAMRPAEYLD